LNKLNKKEKNMFSEQIGVVLYCIRNKEGDYWNNDWGWMRLYDEEDELEYTIFTEEEKNKFNLPMGNGVYWEKM